MSNMSYCRFENTLQDLKDCLDHWEDDLSDSEKEAKAKMLKVIFDILDIEGIGNEQD